MASLTLTSKPESGLAIFGDIAAGHLRVLGMTGGRVFWGDACWGLFYETG